MKRLRFVIHTQYYPPETGAPQRRLSSLAEGLAGLGHDVTVLTAMPSYPLGRLYPGYSGIVSRDSRNGVKIIRLRIYPTSSVRFLPRLANYFSFVITSLLFGTFLVPRVDYLLTESPPLFLGMAGYLLSRMKRARWIFNVSDLWPESAVQLGVVGPGMLLSMAECLETFCYRKAWLVTGQSREILAWISERNPSVETYHLSNGVDPRLFSPKLRNEALHDSLGDGAECVAVYAGLHGIAQGLDQIVDAAHELRPLEGRLRILFVGDGSELPSLKRRAQGNVIAKFVGPRPADQMPEVLSSCDIALVPLKKHLPGAVPSKIYEAMGSGLPIVLVARGEAADIVRDTGAGLVAEPGDVPSLIRCLGRLVHDAALRRTLGGRGRNAAVTRYNRHEIAREFAEFLSRGDGVGSGA